MITWVFIFRVTKVSSGATVVTREISLGPSEIRLLFELEKESKTIFTFSDALRILNSSKAAAKTVIHRLKHKGRITSVEKGKYVLVPARAGIEGNWSENPFRVLSHIIDEYYVGFWTAMSHWGMTEQIPLTVFVATTMRKRRITYIGQPFRFITVSKQKFFGFTQEKIRESGETFNISTKEKTIADGLVFPQYCGGIGEVAKAIWNSRKELDWKQVLSTAERMQVDVAVRRLGFILSLLKIAPKISRSLAQNEWYGLRSLDPSGLKEALAYSKEYGLIINVSIRSLTSWRGT